MAIKPFFKKNRRSVRRPAERISDLRIVTRDFTLINGEAEFHESESARRYR